MIVDSFNPTYIHSERGIIMIQSKVILLFRKIEEKRATIIKFIMIYRIFHILHMSTKCGSNKFACAENEDVQT